MEKQNKRIGRFISPVKIYSRVKEELRSYFNTGSVDDMLFPEWTNDCLEKFINTYKPQQQAVMDLHNFKCELPCDFRSVKEVYVVTTYEKGPITSPAVFYYQTDCRINPSPTSGDSCSSCVGGYQCFGASQSATPQGFDNPIPNLCDVPDEFIVNHKVMDQFMFSFDVTGLLKPSNFRTLDKMDSESPNRGCSSMDTFDISGNKMITSFRTGTIFMTYYADPYYNEDGYPMIPDEEMFGKYLYHYLRYMMYVQLVDQSTEDTYKLLKAKKDSEVQDLGTAWVNARNYSTAETVYQVMESIKRSYNRNNRFLIR